MIGSWYLSHQSHRPRAHFEMPIYSGRLLNTDSGVGSIKMTFLVHAAPDFDPEGHALVDWIVANRRLELSPIAELPDRLA